MHLSYSKLFIKQAKNLNPQTRKKLEERLRLFAQAPFHPTLHNHLLKGELKGYRSINITGDIRALYLKKSDEAIFDTVGSHSQLYG